MAEEERSRRPVFIKCTDEAKGPGGSRRLPFASLCRAQRPHFDLPASSLSFSFSLLPCFWSSSSTWFRVGPSMGRAPCCDKANVKRGPWSPEEDVVLRSYIEKHGTGGNWIALPQKAGLNRCGKSCRLRWLNYLRPDIKHGGFTEEEDDIICSLYRKLGSRWSIIASHLRGRTDNDVKNYWNTKLKKKLIASSNNDAVKNPSATTPPPAFLHAVAVKFEPKNNYAADSISKLYSPPLSSNHLGSRINDQEGSVSSSTITADDCSGSSRASEEDMLLSEFDLGFLSELLGGYGDEEKLGEMPLPPPLLWTASELRYS